MNLAPSFLKAFLACAILWLAYPNPALCQNYGTTYDNIQRYGQQTERGSPDPQSEHNDGGLGGLPWWAWAIIVLIVIAWLFGDDDSGSSAPRNRPRPNQRRRYVDDPSR